MSDAAVGKPGLLLMTTCMNGEGVAEGHVSIRSAIAHCHTQQPYGVVQKHALARQGLRTVTHLWPARAAAAAARGAAVVSAGLLEPRLVF